MAAPAKPEALQANPGDLERVKLRSKPTASTGQGGDLARRRYQQGQIIFSKSRQVWLGRYREDTIRADGTIIRTRPQVLLGTKKDLPTQRLAHQRLLLPANPHRNRSGLCSPLARGGSRKAQTLNGLFREVASQRAHHSATRETPPGPDRPRESANLRQPTCRSVEEIGPQHPQHSVFYA
jgi:hypothetical protein